MKKIIVFLFSLCVFIFSWGVHAEKEGNGYSYDSAVIHNHSKKPWKVSFSFAEGGVYVGQLDSEYFKELPVTINPNENINLFYRYDEEKGRLGKTYKGFFVLSGKIKIADNEGKTRCYTIKEKEPLALFISFFPYIFHDGNTGPVVLNDKSGGDIDLINDSWGASDSSAFGPTC